MRKNLERALSARRESRRVEFKERFDRDSKEDWCEVVKDVVAMANSGGGVILFGVSRTGEPLEGEPAVVAALDPSEIAERIRRETGVRLAEIEVVPALKDSKPVVALVVNESPTLLIFNGNGASKTAPEGSICAFARGSLYVRRGAKSEPARSEDIAAAIERRVNETKRSWLNAVKTVVQLSGHPESVKLSQEVRDSDSPDATPIRVVDDPVAPAFRLIDYDKTHPYRQKELLAAFRQRVPEMDVNQFDLLSIRHVHQIDQSRDFSHRSMFGTRQYSEKFLRWLVENAQRDPNFFHDARAKYRMKLRS